MVSALLATATSNVPLATLPPPTISQGSPPQSPTTRSTPTSPRGE